MFMSLYIGLSRAGLGLALVEECSATGRLVYSPIVAHQLPLSLSIDAEPSSVYTHFLRGKTYILANIKEI